MKTLQVYSNSEAHEDAVHHYYDLTKDGNKVTLKTSNDSIWHDHAQEEWRAGLEDSGNGYIIRLGDRQFHFDYSESYELLVLLLVTQEDRIKIVEQTTILEL